MESQIRVIAIADDTGLIGKTLYCFILHAVTKYTRFLDVFPPNPGPDVVGNWQGNLASSVDLRPFVDGAAGSYHCTGEARSMETMGRYM